MKTVDTRGHKCPKPLILVREAILSMDPEEEMVILIDNQTSLKNLTSYLKDQGSDPQITTEGNSFTLKALRPQKSQEDVDPELYCDTDQEATDYMVCIKSDLMGEGDPELGKVLMESFLDNLKIQSHLPTHIILYNGGVKLATKRSAVCSSLVELEELGTRIMLCGTCIDHYDLQYDIGVGMISNMISITETLASASKVIYP